MNQEPGKQDKHASLEMTTYRIPWLAEKLTYLYQELGVSQKALAEHLGVSSSAVSQWKTNGIPKAKISALCRYFGIGREELRLDDLSGFYDAVRQRYRADVGNYWRIHLDQYAHTGLKLRVLETSPAVQ